MFYAIANWESSIAIAVVQDLNLHALVKLSDHADELIRITQLCHYFPEAIVAHRVKDFGQIDTVGVELQTFFLELTSCSYHVNCASVCSEVILALWKKMTLLQMEEQAV
ncbi:MAG: hypothetical protein M3H12_15890 [Chromatiales bacterium]